MILFFGTTYDFFHFLFKTKTVLNFPRSSPPRLGLARGMRWGEGDRRGSSEVLRAVSCWLQSLGATWLSDGPKNHRFLDEKNTGWKHEKMSIYVGKVDVDYPATCLLYSFVIFEAWRKLGHLSALPKTKRNRKADTVNLSQRHSAASPGDDMKLLVVTDSSYSLIHPHRIHLLSYQVISSQVSHSWVSTKIKRIRCSVLKTQTKAENATRAVWGSGEPPGGLCFSSGNVQRNGLRLGLKKRDQNQQEMAIKKCDSKIGWFMFQKMSLGRPKITNRNCLDDS